MSPLRIVHIDSGLTWRGGQRQALLLGLGLRERGHESFLIASPGAPLSARARAGGLAVATTPMRADWDLQAAARIRSRIRAWRADIVHAHDARSHALAMLALMGRKHPPLVVTRRVPFTPRSVRLKYGDRIARFIAISEAVRDAMVRGGIEAARIDVVYSGIELPSREVEVRDWRGELAWPADTVIAGVVGAMTAEKGLDSLEQMGRHVTPAAASRLRLVLLGGTRSGPLSIGGLQAFHAGFVEDIIPAIGGLDFLIHPSREEGLGTSVLDAMALGVPPVAFAVGGLVEVVEDGESGLLVKPGDARALAEAVGRLTTEPRPRERLGAGARKRVKSFEALQMTKGTEAVYNRVLRG